MKKWHKVVLVIIVVVGILIAVKSCVDKKNPDLTAAYIGYDFVDFEVFEKADFENIVPDINGDGSVNIDMMEISFNEELGQADRENAQKKMANALGMGAARIYFIEEQFVINNASSGVFADIGHLGDGFRNSDGQVVAIKIAGNDKAEKMGINTDGNMYIAVRTLTEVDAATDKKIAEKHAIAMEFAKYILS